MQVKMLIGHLLRDETPAWGAPAVCTTSQQRTALTSKAITSFNSDSCSRTPWNKPGHTKRCNRLLAKRLKQAAESWINPIGRGFNCIKRHLSMLQTMQAISYVPPPHPGIIWGVQLAAAIWEELSSRMLKASQKQSCGVTPSHIPTKHSQNEYGFGSASVALPRPKKTSKPHKTPRRSYRLLQAGAGTHACVPRRWQATEGSDGHVLPEASRASALQDMAPHTEIKLLLRFWYKTGQHPHLHRHSCHGIVY